AITKNYPKGVLSFIGPRKYESEARNSKPRIWQNPWTPGQTGASPIQNWCAMHVWMYIFLRKEPFNVWYTRGLDRSGASCAPLPTSRSSTSWQREAPDGASGTSTSTTT
ncbi:MAG: phosphoadenosine phosphosulfate reductase family protein, partial [Candidatus Methanomethylophilaceae archaeon]|nr:phosphoadenosine phosphosulfate reductase family protein [Candidatus Methanomethylophilaceae archaeon]